MKLSEVIVACMGVPSIQTTATPMRSSEVQASTTWDSLKTARAACCIPLGLMSTLICKIKGKFDLKMLCCLVEAYCSQLLVFLCCEQINLAGGFPHGAKMVHEKNSKTS